MNIHEGRFLPQGMENFVATTFPYDVREEKPLPQGRFIVVANHDVRGLGGFPSDVYLINDAIRRRRGISPIWLANAGKRYVTFFNKYPHTQGLSRVVSPLVRNSIHAVGELFTRMVEMSPDGNFVGTVEEQILKDRLIQNDVVGIMPQGADTAKRVRHGAMYLSHAVQRQIGLSVPIVPIRIDQVNPRQFSLTIHSPITPVFTDGDYRDQLRMTSLSNVRECLDTLQAQLFPQE